MISPARVCKVLEYLTMTEANEYVEDFEGMVYRWTHTASCSCKNPHEDWVKGFELMEESVIQSQLKYDKNFREKWPAGA